MGSFVGLLRRLATTITLKGLIFESSWAQRPHYIRLLCYFDAKAIALHSGLKKAWSDLTGV